VRCPREWGSKRGEHTLGLGVYPLEVQLLPHHLQQLVDVPALAESVSTSKGEGGRRGGTDLLGGYGDGVRDSVEEVEYCDSDSIDLVERVDNRDVSSRRRLDDIDQVVDRRIASEGNIRGRDLVLAHNGTDFLDDVSTIP